MALGSLCASVQCYVSVFFVVVVEGLMWDIWVLVLAGFWMGLVLVLR